ncbi:hypothetical protein [Sandarakinorhabdus glacialis]|uniref:hypothetical protein n=1 Tax=Sandarakinorhabdus glacialis TaxID=1614636 RepID=UPI00166D7F5A|nr:hypothetical protein [Polymorphobacter glacialis]
MLRTGRAREGHVIRGGLSWQHGDQPAGSIGYTADMSDLNNAALELCYSRGSGATQESVIQRVTLIHSKPHLGGRRWWLLCPFRTRRALKLYLPPGGDRFACAKAWGLAHRSQRMRADDRCFEAMFRMQRQLGGREGFGAGLPPRPKGMWQRTYDQAWARYHTLDDHCSAVTAGLMLRLGDA